MSYDALVITAHPDDAETQMGVPWRSWLIAATRSCSSISPKASLPTSCPAVSGPARLAKPPASSVSSV